MNIEEFITYIKSIGFIHQNNDRYLYKEYKIDLYNKYYEFWYGYRWGITIEINDLNSLTLINIHFKKELRSIKLKKLLSL